MLLNILSYALFELKFVFLFFIGQVHRTMHRGDQAGAEARQHQCEV